MNLIKISYKPYQKNKNRGDDTYWCRVRESGKTPMDVNLHTKSKAQAEAFCLLRTREVELYNAQILANEEPDPSKLLRRDSRLIAQKGTSKAVSIQTEALVEWELELRRTGHREKSIAVYTRALSVIAPKDALVTDMTEDNFRKWLTQFDNLSSATRKNYSVTLREFTKFCSARYGLDYRLIDRIPRTKVQHVEKGFWTMQQMAAIINAVQCKDDEQTETYKAFFWTLATVGSRCSETRELLWSDLSGNVITFRAENTKTNVTRRCPVDWRIVQMLNRLPRTGEHIFERLPPSQASWHHVLQRAIKASKMPKGNLHQFRRSISAIMYKTTSNIKMTAQYLGHSETTSLRFYQMSRQADELKELVDKTFEHEILIPNAMDELIKAGLI